MEQYFKKRKMKFLGLPLIFSLASLIFIFSCNNYENSEPSNRNSNNKNKQNKFDLTDVKEQDALYKFITNVLEINFQKTDLDGVIFSGINYRIVFPEKLVEKIHSIIPVGAMPEQIDKGKEFISFSTISPHFESIVTFKQDFIFITEKRYDENFENYERFDLRTGKYLNSNKPFDAQLEENNINTEFEVSIGDQIWMNQNLNVEKFLNGDPIPEAKTNEEWIRAKWNKQPAWCYYNNDSTNGEKYGKLYNWHAVNDSRGLAPKGYHIPTDVEWKQFIDNLGGEGSGIKIKSNEDWVGGESTNESGFSGLPGGSRLDNGTFMGLGKSTEWWSSTEEGNTSSYACFVFINYNYRYVQMDWGGITGMGYSVRCIRD